MSDTGRNELPSGLHILLPGVPGVTSRGFLGYCTVTLFALDGKNQWGLFDTGHYSDRHLLLLALGKAGIGPNDIRHIILSHLHFDHILNVTLFPRAEVYVSDAEIEYAQQVSARQVVDHAVPDFWPSLLKNRSVHGIQNEFELGPGRKLTVWPGHTPGGLVMLCQGSPTTAVCGDVIKNAWEAVGGRAAAAVSADDAAASIRAVRAQAEVLVPGHDRPFRHFPGGLEYLYSFHWEVRTSLFPEPMNQLSLSLEKDETEHLCSYD